MRDRAVGLLRERVGRLDDGPLPVVPFDGGAPALSPADADELAGTCRLLADIARGGAGLVDGRAWPGISTAYT